MKEQEFAVSIFGQEETLIVPFSELKTLLDSVKEEDEKIEYIYDLDEFKSMYPLTI